MKILFFYILLLILKSPVLFASSINDLKEDYNIYEAKKGESLKRVAQKNIDLVAGNYKSLAEYMLDIKSWNNHVDNWSKIGGEQLYVTYPYSPHTGIHWSPSLAKFKDVAKVPYFESEYHKSGRTLSEFMHMFAHITVSQGSFLEQIGSSKITFEQNSPFTLGIGYAYLFQSFPELSNSSSIYYSKLNSAGVKTSGAINSNDDISIPAEIGATSYLQKNFSSIFSNIYGGFDFEKFSTFNLEEIIDGTDTDVDIKNNQILYITGGIGLKFSIFSPINIKVSMSKGVVATGKFNGIKYLLYMNQKLGKKFWYHIIYKQHVLTGGKSDLTVGRLGVGLGMSLF